MSESLQDQLLALGLAKSKPRKGPKKPRRRKASGKGRAGAKKTGGEISLDAAYRARDKDEKSSADKAKAEKRALDLERRRVNSQIQQLLEGNTLNDPKAELKRNFLFKGRIRTVLVTPEQLEALNDGTLGLVFLRGNYLVVKPELRDEIKALSDDHVPDLAADEGANDEGDHPVPDDLIW